jgi:hypothetical protein
MLIGLFGGMEIQGYLDVTPTAAATQTTLPPVQNSDLPRPDHTKTDNPQRK